MKNKLKIVVVAILLLSILFTITACGEKTCKVVFMDGETEFSSVEVELGEKVVLPTPTKDGYKFVHWCTDKELTTPYDNTEVQSALTLYAKFEEQKIYISVNSNGGGAVSAIEVKYNQSYEVAVPVRDGYTFTGYTYDNGEKDVDFPLTGLYPYKQSIRIRANWSINTGTIGLDGDDAVDESTALFVDKGTYFKERSSLSEEFTYVFTTGSTANFNGVKISTGNTSLVTLNAEQNSFTVGHTPGEFVITVHKGSDSYNRNAKIVKQILTLSDGEDFVKTSQESLNNSDFVNTVKSVQLVGKNNFKPDLSIVDAANQKMTIAEAEIIVSIKDENDNVVTDYTIDSNDVITFGDSLVGKVLNITYKGKYDASKVKKTTTQTVKINEAVNVYNDAELRATFKDLNVNEINILRNIKAQLTPDHYIAGTSDPKNENGYSVYYRLSKDKAAANCVINGNYFTIDGTSLPLINCDYYGEGNYNSWGAVNYGSAKVQVAIFEFQNSYNGGKYNGNKLTINNLRIDSNTNPSKMEETRSKINSSKEVLVQSGAYNGINIRGGQAEYNNLVITKTKNAIWGDGGIYLNGDKAEHATIINVNECHVINSFSNCVYMWDTAKVDIKNTKFEEVAAATIHFYDRPHPENVDQELIIDDYTLEYLNNPKTGTEIWFKAYNQESAASYLKDQAQGGLTAMLNNVGRTGQLAVINNTLRENDEFINFAIVIQKEGNTSEWTQDQDNKGRLYFNVQTGSNYKLYDLAKDGAELQTPATQQQAALRILAYKEGDLVSLTDNPTNPAIIAYAKLYPGSVYNAPQQA